MRISQHHRTTTHGTSLAFVLASLLYTTQPSMAATTQHWQPTKATPGIALSDGSMHPAIGYGTYKVGFVPASASAAAAGQQTAGAEGPSARDCVRQALDVGYRFLDCAQFYGNEAQVGAAICESGVPRDELYLASKVWTDNIFAGREAVRAQVVKTLMDLGVESLDLYCVHWPVPGKHVDAYLELEACQREGLIRSLGISNYALEDYLELMQKATIKPVVNQIEVNPFLYRRRTLAAFEAEGVKIQAYRALRDGKAFGDPVVAGIAAAHGRSPAQVLGRWCVQKGCIYIPKSVKRQRMIENAQVFDFALSDAEMTALDGLTTEAAVGAFAHLYRTCVNRDTPLAGTLDGVKMEITEW
ncbi:NADP-dependent oxidoreductase domain-containing protein [Pavlovales sp. CCMP2436]|nr:NADP-dependent oxidoreductase domain-containing protein [Pavlovales sp. CCMP2436]|mmetsp:Transcript_34319/g.85526  ORF Transcript_34319/g.85526 Transcript_34319/m.85526 type:complete len:357 (+) Transcript_34319:2-1072(+)